MLRAISVFGATGSVGQSTFDLLMRQGGPASNRTVALTAPRCRWRGWISTVWRN